MMLFAGIVLLAHAVQHAVGFGAMLVSITVGAHLLDLRQIITLSIPLALVQAGAVVWRDRAAVARPLLLRRILPLMSLGLLLGFFAAGQVRGDALRSVFAGLVIVLASRELWVLWRERAGSRSDRPPPRALSIAALFGAGVVHGLYATGGPLLVYAVGREPLDKRGFRATLSAVWLGLNALLIGGFIFEGRYTLDTLRPLVVL
ncbi:MAG: TSUP family transporter, partial [Myxococcales bacterium]|nr:TSUP family transporter [Myxococcales bacterium]